MSNIINITDPWQGHSGLEVENFIKSEITSLAASLGGKFGYVAFNSQTMTITFFDEAGGTALGSVQLGGQVYSITAACNLSQVFYVLADEIEKIMTITPSTTVSSFGSSSSEPFPESYTYVVAVNSGAGYIDRVTGTIATGGSASFDIKPYLSTGDNYIRVAVTGTSSGQTKTSVFTGVLTTLTMSCNHAWQNVWTQGQDYNITGIRFAGNLIKELHVAIDNVELPNSPVTYSANQSYTTTSTYFTIPATSFPTGGSSIHSIKLWMTAQGVSTPVISYNIMCAATDDNTPLVAINAITDRAYNFTSSTLFSYAVYNANKVSIDMSATLNSVNYIVATGIVVTGRDEGVQYPFAYSIEVDTGANETQIGSIAFSAKAYLNSTEGITTTASSIFDNTYSYLATPGYLFYMNAATRDNGASNYETIVNEAGASENFAATYDATWTGMSWYNDGWSTDPSGNKALCVPAGCTVEVDDLTPLSLLASYDGMTVEFMMQSGSPSDYATPIISLASGDNTPVGILIYPTKIVVWGSSERDEDYQTINFSENAMTHICITFLKGYEANAGKNLCSVYINGISNVNFAFDGASSFGNGGLVLGQSHTDTYLYKMRVYGSALESGAVFNNFLNSIIDGVEYNRSVLNAKNDVLLGSTVDYEMVKRAGFNTMVVTTPHDEAIPSFFNNVTIDGCSVKFEYAGQQTKNVLVENVSMDGQGTTSKKYYRWNLRWKTGSSTNWIYGDGTSVTGSKSGRMINDANYIQVDRITAKKNIASSPQGHKMGLTGLYNDLFHQIGLDAELPNQNYRVAVYQFPFVGFQYNSANQSYEFIGIYTAGPDKGSKKTFGYSSDYADCLSIEGPNHAPRGTRFLCPWVDVAYDPDEETLTYGGEEGWDADYVKFETSREKGTQQDWDNILALYESEWQPAYNCVYDNSPYLASYSEVISALNNPNITTLSDLLDAENAATVKGGTTNNMLVKNEFIAFYDSSYDLYFYRRSTAKFEKLPNDYAGYKNALTDMSTYLNSAVNPSAPTTAELITARALRFKATMGNYFSQNQTIYHYCFCLLYGVTDNYAKNSYPFKFLALDATGAGNRWGWRQDDLDSVLMTDNNGTNTKSYSVEHLDTVNGVQLFQGGDSALWVLIKNNYEEECRAMMSQIATAANALATSLGIAGSGLHESLFNLTDYHCWQHSSKYFPATIYESDRRWSYIEPWILAGTLRTGTGETYPATYNGVAPLTQALGDQLQGEKLWMYRRIAYMFSKYHIGAFHGTQTGYNAIVFTLAESFTFTLTPAIDLYPVVSLVDDDVVAGRTPAGSTASLSISTTGDSNNSIHGGDWLASLGDLSGMKLTSRGGSSSIEFSVTGARLQTLKIGDATAGNVDFNATVFGVTSPTLLTLDARNTSTITNTVNLLGCPRLTTCLFEGSGAAGLYLPVGAKLTEVSFPDNSSTVFMHSLPFLTDEDITMPDLAGIANLYINNCPNLDPLDIADDILNTQNNSLAYVTLIWRGIVNKNRTAIDTITALDNLSGHVSFTNNNPTSVNGKPDVEGTLQVDNVYSGDLEALDIVSEETYSGTLKKALVGLFNTPLYLIYDSAATYITFADSTVGNICATNWGDGLGLTINQAATVTSLNEKFKGNTTITSFDELKYFTGMTYTNGTSPTTNSLLNAFQGCTALTSVSLPIKDFQNGSYVYILQNTFSGCSNLERIYWGFKRMQQTSNYAFSGCTNLKRIDIPSLTSWLTMRWITAITNARHPFVVSGEGHLYVDGVEITNLVIPNGTTTINEAAFLYCKGITSISLPSTVTSLYEYAFRGCTNAMITGLDQVTSFGSYCLGEMGTWGSATDTFSNTTTATFSSSVFNGTPIKNLTLKSATFNTSTLQGAGRSSDPGTAHLIGNVTAAWSSGGSNNANFKTFIIEGNMSVYGAVYNCRHFKLTGNLTWAGNGSYNVTYYSYPAYVEFLGTISSSTARLVSRPVCIHLAQKVTSTAAATKMSEAQVFLIGDGTSSAADQAIIAAYSADSNWSDQVSKMIPYYDYLNMVRVEYLETDGNQFINFVDQVHNDMRVVIDAQYTDMTSGALFGWQGASGTHRFQMQIYQGEWYFGASPSGASAKWVTLDTPAVDTQRHTFELRGDGYCAVDSSTGQIAVISGEYNSSCVPYFFCQNNNGTKSGGKNRIFNAKIYRGNFLWCDLVPVRIGQIGYMYDQVSGALYPNMGTGSFTLGPDIVE